MERATIDQGIELLQDQPAGFSALAHLETENSCYGRLGSRLGSRLGCSRFGRGLDFLTTTVRRFVHEAWEKQLTYRVVRSYKKTLRDYNVSHVMEKTAGEDNLIRCNAFDRLERYRITVEDPGAPWVKLFLYSTNNNENEETVHDYHVPALREREIAYKLVDGSVAAESEMAASVSPHEQQAQLMCQYEREKKILSALDHPNIIKPVIINETGKIGEDGSWQARKRVVIETRPLSVTERCELAATITEHDGEGHEIDFDFEVVESFEEGPAGIPLPLAETTLLNAINAGLLSGREKYSIARAMVDAVAYAHRRGCVHFNIKPANIVKIDDSWVLTGWTLAHHYRDMLGGSLDFMPAYNKQGYFLFGSDNYQAPQICVRKNFCTRDAAVEREIQAMKTGNGQAPFCETDAREADAYSLGIVLFELLTVANPTPSARKLQNTAPRHIEKVFQENTDQYLQEYKENLGEYHEVVSLLLQSKCSDRISVATAAAMLGEISPP